MSGRAEPCQEATIFAYSFAKEFSVGFLVDIFHLVASASEVGRGLSPGMSRSADKSNSAASTRCLTDRVGSLFSSHDGSCPRCTDGAKPPAHVES